MRENSLKKFYYLFFQLSKLLASENAMLKEECLKILNQLLSHPKLAEILVKDSGIQDPIMVLARDEDTCVRLNLPANESFCRIQTLVLHVLDKVDLQLHCCYCRLCHTIFFLLIIIVIKLKHI